MLNDIPMLALPIDIATVQRLAEWLRAVSERCGVTR
jgi:hypothetical protein